MPQFSGSLCLKLIVGVHFTLSTWATTETSLLPPAYNTMHVGIIVCGLLAILHQDNNDMIFMLLGMLAVSIVTDAVFLGCYDPDAHHQIESLGVPQHIKNRYRFALGMAIVNILLKPGSMVLLLIILKQRPGGEDSLTGFRIPGLPSFGGAGEQGGYETIDGAAAARTDSGLQTAQHHQSLDDKSGAVA